MSNKTELSKKLTEAFDRGFIPAEIRKYMDANGHSGQVWVVDQDDTTHQVEEKGILREESLERIGIGYRLPEDAGGSGHIMIYTLPEIETILREIKGRHSER